VREIGSMMQLMPLLIVPFVGVIQSCRYFLKGPQDLFTVGFLIVVFAQRESRFSLTLVYSGTTSKF
jgi:hypothetical protein